MTDVNGLLLLGGARSGKSSQAERAVHQSAARHAKNVTVVVTGVVTDDEMAQRISRHQAERPPDWHTVEAPYALVEAVSAVEREHVLLVDCVTVWLSNLLVRGDSVASIEAQGALLADTLAARTAPAVVVSNDVSMGVVPGEQLGRTFRDIQGRVNQRLAGALDRSFLVVAGRLLPLENTIDPWS